MAKAFVPILAFSFLLLALTSVAAEPQNGFETIGSSNNLQTRVLVDSLGDVHVLWLIPPLNGSASGPGIWYAKYTRNGTASIPPTRISDSTTAKYTDLTADNQGNAIIVWAETNNTETSALSLLRFNSTSSLKSEILSTKGSLILWPSVAVDNNDTIHLTWTQYSPQANHALVEYGTVSKNQFSHSEAIASYDGVSAFPPKARIVFDNSSEHVQIAWGETQSLNRSVSTVDYAKLVTNGTVLTRLQVARFNATLRDVSITATQGHDGAFVLWQTDSSNASVFVSQISAAGQLTYLEQLKYPTGQSKYLTVSTDSQNNLYVLWYQPSTLSAPTPQSPPPVTNVAYMRMNIDGDIVETWNGIVREQVISMAVSGDGTVYAVSPAGLVRVTMPSQSYGPQWIAAFVLAGCVGVFGAFSTEEGRYRMLALYSKGRSIDKVVPQNNEVIRVLARKPGLKLHDIRRFVNRDPANMRLLVRLEKAGELGSFRDGFSRRFYVKAGPVGPVDIVPTRILLWIMEHPGTWEAQLSKDLGLSQQIVHYHLKKLRDSGLITTTVDRDGTRKLYRFTTAKQHDED